MVSKLTSEMPKRRYHDDQDDEAYYDKRKEADDDVAKGQIRFPQGKLFGRDEELNTMHDFVQSLGRFQAPSKLIWVAGPSGVGKSALVDQLRTNLNQASMPVQICEGKYNQCIQGNPFSAIGQALANLVRQEQAKWSALQQSSVKSNADARDSTLSELLESNRKHLEASASFWNSAEGKLMLELFPSLSGLESLCNNPTGQHDSSSVGDGCSIQSERILEDGSTAKNDMNAITMAAVAFFRLWSRPQQPFILYLDDLQWADVASLELLESLMLNQSLRHFLLIGSYRSNELDQCPRLQKVLENCDNKEDAEQTVRCLSLTNLAPRFISALFMETLDVSEEEVKPITDLVYSKTLGNIFFSRQALEELVRKNALYYDMMFFRWNFSLKAADCLEEQVASKTSILSRTVVEMIQNKLRSMKKCIQRALVVASYIRHSIDIPTLLAVLKADVFPEMNHMMLRRLLEDAVAEGLVLKQASNLANTGIHKALSLYDDKEEMSEFRFSHDRVQEAAFSLVPPGEERHKLFVQIAYVLLGMATISNNPQDEWMLYVALKGFGPNLRQGRRIQLHC